MTTDHEGLTSEPAASSAPEPDPADAPTSRRSPWVIVVAAISAGVILFLISRIVGPAPQLAPAMKLVNRGKLPEAEKALAEYLRFDPEDPRARITLADVQMSLSPPKPAEAIETLEPIGPLPPADAAVVHVLRGKAYEAQDFKAKAEAEWREALRLDPLAAEAGHLLLQLYYFQGRVEESRLLALQLSKVEPEPRDRVRLLLAPMQFDAEPVAASGLIPMFREAVKLAPDDLGSSLAYYRALARDGVGIDEGLKGLRDLVRAHPDDAECRRALLGALDAVGDQEGLEKAIAEVPPSLAKSPKIAVYRGILASRRGDRDAAIREFESAVAADPSDATTLHRLGEAYKLAGKAEQAEAAKAREKEIEDARIELRGIKGREAGASLGRPGLYDDLATRPDLGLVPNPVLYHRVASLRERMGHPDEALAWHRLALRDDPDDAESREAVSRLEVAAPAPTSGH